MPRARWAARIALTVAAAGGVVAACYDKVPGPSGPLPPTKEVQGLAPKPKKLAPTVVEMHTEIGGAQEEPAQSPPAQTGHAPHSGPPEPAPVPSPTSPTHEMHDAGVNDVVDLPPVPDSAVPLDAPGVHKRER
jgi:hypothetical protein